MTRDSRNELCLELFDDFLGIFITAVFLNAIAIANIVSGTDWMRDLLVQNPGLLQFRDMCEFCSSHWTAWGRALRLIWSAFSAASFIFYIVHTCWHPHRISFEKTTEDTVLIYIDLGFNLYFLVFFGIRYIASDNKWSFTINPETWMEILTIGPAITAVTGEKKHLMLSFLRGLRLIGLRDVVFLLGLVQRPSLKSLTHILSRVVCFWFVFAGIFHLLENAGGYTKFTTTSMCAEKPEDTVGSLDYFSCLYFLLVTASTVGYGEISPTNTISKTAVLVFVIIAVTFFATILPQLLSICTQHSTFANRSFDCSSADSHVILCGSSQLSNLRAFFYNFFERDDKGTRVCLLSSQQVTGHTLWFLRSFCGKVSHVFGSPTEAKALHACKLKGCDAVILASEAGQQQQQQQPQQQQQQQQQVLAKSDLEADRVNYVRAISAKLARPSCRIIVQIRSMHHKKAFRSLPQWRSRPEGATGLPADAVLCDNQMQLGLMGLNCVCPGLSTLLINLLAHWLPGRSSRSSSSRSGSWRSGYSHGFKAKLHCVAFAATHRYRSLKSVTADAYLQHRVLVVGACMVDEATGVLTGVLNPSHDAQFLVNPSTMRAFLLARSEASVAEFCNSRPPLATDAETSALGADREQPAAVPASANATAEAERVTAQHWQLASRFSESVNDDDCMLMGQPADGSRERILQHFELDARNNNSSSSSRVVSVGVPYPKVNDGSKSSFEGVRQQHRASASSRRHAAEHRQRLQTDITGTLHWVPSRPCLPLTVAEAASVDFSGHVLVVLLGRQQHALGLSSFLLPLRNRAIPADELRDVVILGDVESIDQHEWSCVRNFPLIFVVAGSGQYPQHLLLCRAHRAAAVVVFNMTDDADADDAFQRDRRTLRCIETVRGLCEAAGRRPGDCHVTSELKYSANAYCLSDPKERPQDVEAAGVADTQAFAEGLLVASSNLSGLLASACFCPETLAFLETFVFGSNQPGIDEHLSLDFCIPGGDAASAAANDGKRRVCTFRPLLLSAAQWPICRVFSEFQCKEMRWEELLLGCLDKYNVLCLGVYRLRNREAAAAAAVAAATSKAPADEAATADGAGGRFVLTLPDHDWLVDITDKFFCLTPPPHQQQQQQQQQ